MSVWQEPQSPESRMWLLRVGLKPPVEVVMACIEPGAITYGPYSG